MGVVADDMMCSTVSFLFGGTRKRRRSPQKSVLPERQPSRSSSSGSFDDTSYNRNDSDVLETKGDEYRVKRRRVSFEVSDDVSVVAQQTHPQSPFQPYTQQLPKEQQQLPPPPQQHALMTTPSTGQCSNNNGDNMPVVPQQLQRRPSPYEMIGSFWWGTSAFLPNNSDNCIMNQHCNYSHNRSTSTLEHNTLGASVSVICSPPHNHYNSDCTAIHNGHINESRQFDMHAHVVRARAAAQVRQLRREAAEFSCDPHAAYHIDEQTRKKKLEMWKRASEGMQLDIINEANGVVVTTAATTAATASGTTSASSVAVYSLCKGDHTIDDDVVIAAASHAHAFGDSTATETDSDNDDDDSVDDYGCIDIISSSDEEQDNGIIEILPYSDDDAINDSHNYSSSSSDDNMDSNSDTTSESGQDTDMDTTTTAPMSFAIRRLSLTPSDERRCARALHPERTLDRVLSNGFFGNLEVTRSKAMCLQPACWLNDEVINFFLSVLQRRNDVAVKWFNSHNRHVKMWPKCFVANTYFYTKLANLQKPAEEREYCYAGVRRYTRRLKMDVFSCDCVVVPVHVGDSHWCLAIIYLNQKRLVYHDSMGGSHSKCLQHLQRWLNDESMDKRNQPLDATGWEMVYSGKNVPQQNNTDDCGMFMLKFAEAVVEGLDIHKSLFDPGLINLFRDRVLLDILSGEDVGQSEDSETFEHWAVDRM